MQDAVWSITLWLGPEGKSRLPAGAELGLAPEAEDALVSRLLLVPGAGGGACVGGVGLAFSVTEDSCFLSARLGLDLLGDLDLRGIGCAGNGGLPFSLTEDSCF